MLMRTTETPMPELAVVSVTAMLIIHQLTVMLIILSNETIPMSFAYDLKPMKHKLNP